MLKQIGYKGFIQLAQRQPPSGGCVLKHIKASKVGDNNMQPPSGGCVLKRRKRGRLILPCVAAAFGRLCVETF